MIIKKEVAEKISKELSLHYSGTEQDWELELADADRIDDFLNFYKHAQLSNDERLALMALIFASYDDFLNKWDLSVDGKWDQIKTAVSTDRLVFEGLIDYWSLKKEVDSDDLLKITPLIWAL